MFHVRSAYPIDLPDKGGFAFQIKRLANAYQSWKSSISAVSVQFFANRQKIQIALIFLSKRLVRSQVKRATQLQSRQFAASVALVKALGGGWEAGQLPPPDAITQGAALSTTKMVSSHD
jgi:hypothetical protein